MDSPSLFEEIGLERIAKVIREFYERAFVDPIICHFFVGKDHELLFTRQVHFTAKLLGAKDSDLPEPYASAVMRAPLGPIHKPLGIRRAHFNRRKVMMREVMEEMGLLAHQISYWLYLEEKLRPLIHS